MPRTTRKRKTPSSFKRKRSTKRRTRRTKRRSGTLGDIHSFKGIVNAGVISAIPLATSAITGGQYVMKLTDVPILASGGGLSNTFNFVRLNRCRLEFMPRYNMSTAPNTAAGGTAGEPLTFLSGMSEVPLANGSSAIAVAPSWSSEGGDAGTVTETTAYSDANAGPSYIRGMPNVKETEIFKKHSVSFIPTFYSYLNSSGTAPISSVPIFEARKKHWVNLNYLNQLSNTDVQSIGPDFYGPIYAFSNNLPAGTSAIAYYDVKLHYSISFKSVRGVHN